MKIEEFKGKTFKSIDVINKDTEIIFTENTGQKYRMFHERDCCESVYLEDICGDIDDLIMSPILMAEERMSNNTHPETSKMKDEKYLDSFTWTFYKLATMKGYVTLRWFGCSNGYYSEKVSLEKLGDEE